MSKYLKQLTGKTTWIILLYLLIIKSSGVMPPAEAQTLESGWSKPVDITFSSEGSFGFLLCDSYQNLHVLWSDYTADNAGNGGLYYRSMLGDRWSQPIDVVTSNKIIIRPSAAIEPASDTLHVFWVDAFVDGNLFYAQAPLSTAGDSRSWSKPEQLQERVQGVSTAVDHEGTIHLVYDGRDSTGRQLSLYHSFSDDNGSTWSKPVGIYNSSTDLPSTIMGRLAVDGSGRLHVGATVRSDEYGEYSAIHYLRSEDGGANWTLFRDIDPMGEVSPGVSTLTPFAFDEDEIHLTWHNPRRMHMWSRDGGSTWTNPDEIVALGAAFGGANEIARDSAGQLFAVTAVDGGVFVSRWNGSAWHDTQQIEDRSFDPHGQHLVACQGNQLHVVYYDRVGENTVWYATKTVGAPAIASSPIPNAAEEPLEIATIAGAEQSETQLETESNAQEVPIPDFSKEAPESGSLMRPFQVSIIIVCIFLAAVIVYLRRKMNRSR